MPFGAGWGWGAGVTPMLLVPAGATGVVVVPGRGAVPTGTGIGPPPPLTVIAAFPVGFGPTGGTVIEVCPFGVGIGFTVIDVFPVS